mgnify:CR=1 FL=1
MSDDRSTLATGLLGRLGAGDAHAADELTPLIYDELRSLARGVLSSERPDHTLQATALVHEAYVRLIDQRTLDAQDRGAFLGLAATVMRRVLVDHARARNRLKRAGPGRRVEMGEAEAIASGGAEEVRIAGEDIEALDAALGRLAEVDARKARLVELRFFGGVDEREAAEMVGISRATASREWRMARAWLARELDEGSGGECSGR